MLVLSRKREERIIITLPDRRQITLMVVDIRGDKVRLGLEAPTDILIHRFEVQIEVEKAAAQILAATRSSPAAENV